MFEKTAAWLRRVVQAGQARTESPRVGEEERRVWVRHPANAETTLHPAGRAAAPRRLHARIRDVSQGGVNLVVDQPFDEGSLLSVEIPSSAGPTLEVLACVLRARELDDGQWSLGCNFVNELTHDDMAALGAKRERATPDDPRNWVRFPANVNATCQTVRDEECRTLRAQVLNLSASGVALELSEEVEAGSLLSIDLHGPQGEPLTMLACVVHVTHAEGERWTLGCNFIRELSEEDLEGLL